MVSPAQKYIFMVYGENDTSKIKMDSRSYFWARLLKLLLVIIFAYL